MFASKMAWLGFFIPPMPWPTVTNWTHLSNVAPLLKDLNPGRLYWLSHLGRGIENDLYLLACKLFIGMKPVRAKTTWASLLRQRPTTCFKRNGAEKQKKKKNSSNWDKNGSGGKNGWNSAAVSDICHHLPTSNWHFRVAFTSHPIGLNLWMCTFSLTKY